MLYEAWQSLGKLAVHIGDQGPPSPLHTTVRITPSRSMSWLGTWSEKWSPPVYNDDDDDGSLDVSSSGSDSDSDSDGGAPPAATSST
jgi:hypothetical protein